MDDLIQLIFVAVVIFGAAIWKLIVKLLGSGSAAKTLTEMGRHAKPLIDALSGEESDDPTKRMRQQAEEARREQPSRPQPSRPAALAPAPRPEAEEARMSPMQRLEERLRQFAEQRMEQMQEKPVRQPEVKPAPKPEPVGAKKRVEPAKPAPTPTRRERARPGRYLGGLQAGRAEALREAILLREILGPPKAMAGGLYGGLIGRYGGMSAIVPPPPPPPAAPARTEPTGAVPERVREMYEMGMLTREQYDALCEHFSLGKGGSG